MPTGIEHVAGHAGRMRITTSCIRNRYYRRARLSERKFRELVRCFALDLSTSDTARLTGISVRSTNTVFLKIRQRIAGEIERHSIFNVMSDSASCDLPAPMSPDALTPCNGSPPLLFGIHRCNDSVHTELVPYCSSPLLHNVVSGLQELASIFRPNDWISRYHGLVDVGRGQYFSLQWPDSQELRSTREMNGSEAFWVFTRRRLKRFMGIPRHTFYLHLKETEYRFNHLNDDLYLELLALLRKHPL
jgi:transposase